MHKSKRAIHLFFSHCRCLLVTHQKRKRGFYAQCNRKYVEMAYDSHWQMIILFLWSKKRDQVSGGGNYNFSLMFEHFSSLSTFMSLCWSVVCSFFTCDVHLFMKMWKNYSSSCEIGWKHLYLRISVNFIVRREILSNETVFSLLSMKFFKNLKYANRDRTFREKSKKSCERRNKVKCRGKNIWKWEESVKKCT